MRSFIVFLAAICASVSGVRLAGDEIPRAQQVLIVDIETKSPASAAAAASIARDLSTIKGLAATQSHDYAQLSSRIAARRARKL